MPVRNRKYEEILRLIFGALIALVLLDVIYKGLVHTIHVLFK